LVNRSIDRAVVDVHWLIQKAFKLLGVVRLLVIAVDVVLRVRSLRRKAHRGEAPRCDMNVWSVVHVARLIAPVGNGGSIARPIDPVEVLAPGRRLVDGAVLPSVCARHLRLCASASAASTGASATSAHGARSR
jgi:hypothetical protein